MSSVSQVDPVVNASGQRRRGPGQPSKQTPARIQGINREIVKAAWAGDELPSDEALAVAYGVSERTVRDIRLRLLGLNRHELKRWTQAGRTSALMGVVRICARRVSGYECGRGHSRSEPCRSVLYTPTYQLVGRLLRAKGDYELERELRQLDKFQVGNPG